MIQPSLSEDRKLASVGNIRMEDGTVKYVGSRRAYEMIEERRNNGFYNQYSVDADFEWAAPTDGPVPLKEECSDDKQQLGTKTKCDKNKPGIRGHVITNADDDTDDDT